MALSEANEGSPVEFPQVIPRETRDKVSIGPPPDWVKIVDLDSLSAQTPPCPALLFERQHHAGRNEDYQRVAQRLETMQALHEVGQWSLNFDPGNQRVVIHSLAVIRAGRSVEHARAENLQFLQRESQMEKLVIDGSITVVVVLHDVQIGDVVDVSFSISTDSRILKDRAWLLAVVPSRTALGAFRFSVRFANTRPMRWKSNDASFAPEIIDSGDEIEWIWQKENIDRVEFEKETPSWYVAATWVQVTDCLSWSEVASGMAAAWREDFEHPALTQSAQEIAASYPTPRERAQRAMELVQDDIRYLSVNMNLGGQIPAPPGLVLQRRFGDCKDKSFLLAHLLRCLGINACPVLVNTFLQHTVGDWLPSPSLFNHAIVKFEIDGGTYRVDATLPLQGGGLNRVLPDYGLGLPVADGQQTLEKIPADISRVDSYAVREIYTLPASQGGVATLAVTTVARGRNAEEWRQALAQSGEAELARNREQFYKRIFPKATRSGEFRHEDNRAANEFKVSETFDIPDATETANAGSQNVFHYKAHLVQSALAFTDEGTRKTPLAIPYPCNFEHIIEIRISHPVNGVMRDIKREGKAFAFSRETKNGGNKTAIKFTTKTKADSISVQDFEAHRKLVNELLKETFFSFGYSYGTVAPYQKARVSPLVMARILITAMVLGVSVMVFFSPTHPQFGSDQFDPAVRAILDKTDLNTARRQLAAQLATLTKRQQETDKNDPEAVKQLQKDLDAYNAAKARVKDLEEKYRAEQPLIPRGLKIPDTTPMPDLLVRPQSDTSL